MDFRLVRLGGSGLEVAGTFLLAVEAIKIRNLHFVRERVFRVAALKVNPIIYFVDAKSDAEKNRAGETWFNVLMIFFILLGLGVSFIFLRHIGLGPTHIWTLFRGLIPAPLWVHLVLAVPVGFIVLLLASVVGTSSYTLVVLVLGGIIGTLGFIERQTETGVIGIMGFIFFFIGTALKAYLDWRGL